MKILFLNPHINAAHEIVQELEAHGHALLLPLDVEEAWQMFQLHGTSVSLAILHREGLGGDEGVQLIQKLKMSADQADLPIILSSDVWKDADFAHHQNGSDGVNAYLQWPFSESQILELMEQIFGLSLGVHSEPEGLVVAESEDFAMAVPEESLIVEPEESPVSETEDSLASEPEVSVVSEEEVPRLTENLPLNLPENPVENRIFSQPIGDAVVPGGAVQSPDIETLKKYLLLREQDVAVLSSRLKIADERVQSLENSLKTEREKSADLDTLVDDRKIQLERFQNEKVLEIENLQAELSDLRFQNKAKTDKARVLEQQLKEAAGELERLKERVRNDIRKIRVREKELENKLELIKKDSELLLAGRENKIIELKRKVDLLEFNMDLLQDQFSREKENSSRLREQLAKVGQVVRVAAGLIDSSGGEGSKAS